jgi:hypothetical protein
MKPLRICLLRIPHLTKVQELEMIRDLNATKLFKKEDVTNAVRENGKLLLDMLYEADIHVPQDVKLQPTLLNKIGKWPAYGTTCDCCLGYRIYLALIVGLVIGYFI